MIINQLYIKVLPTSSINGEARRVGSKLERAPPEGGAFFIPRFRYRKRNAAGGVSNFTTYETQSESSAERDKIVAKSAYERY